MCCTRCSERARCFLALGSVVSPAPCGSGGVGLPGRPVLGCRVPAQPPLPGSGLLSGVQRWRSRSRQLEPLWGLWLPASCQSSIGLQASAVPW